MIYLIDLIVFI